MKLSALIVGIVYLSYIAGTALDSGQNGLRSKDWMTKIEVRFDERRQRLKAVCEKHHPLYKGSKNWSDAVMETFLTQSRFSLDLKFGHCTMPKVGSTSIRSQIKKLVRNQNSTSKGPKLIIKIPKFNGSIEDFLREHKSYYFTFVRHPFEKFISGFLNRVRGISRLPEKFFKEEFYGLTYLQFVNYVIKKWNDDDPLQDPLDYHFKPQWLQCGLCEIPYNHVGKLETFKEDFEFILMKNNLDNALSSDVHARNKVTPSP